MNNGQLDEISPAYVGAQVIQLKAADLARAMAFHAVDLTVTIDPLSAEALACGLVLPLELTVTAPSPSGFYRHIYRFTVPSIITFTPREGGQHLVRLGEVGHNKWWGSVVVDVAGDRADPRTT